MTKIKHLSAVCLVAFATIGLSVEKLSAQAEDGNPYSTPINMVVNAGTTEERWGTSHSGMMEPIGLRQNEPAAITLIASSSKANYPVGLAPLDGGEIVTSENPSVANNGTFSFTFIGGRTPGLYRVVVTIGSEQYQLRLYVAKSYMTPDCIVP